MRKPHLGEVGALHSSNTSGPLNTTTLKQLIESISRSEEEEKREIDEFTHKLRQYEHRQHRRQELLEHITSFLQENQEDEETHKITDATSSRAQAESSLHSFTCVQFLVPSLPREKQVPHMDTHTARHTSTSVISILQGEDEMRVHTSVLVNERTSSAFKPVHPASLKHKVSSYSTISSDRVTPTSQQLMKPVASQPQITRQYHNDEEELSFRHPPQVRQLMTPLPYKPAASYHKPQNATNHPPPQSPSIYSQPHYTPMPYVVPSHSLLFPSLMTDTSPAVQSQFPTNQTAAPYNFIVQPCSINGVPKPKITNFSTDSER